MLSWKPTATPISTHEQAVVAQALRWLNIAVHADAVTANDPIGAKESTRQKWDDFLKKSVAEDVDVASLRWLLWFWDQTRDEVSMAKELGNGAYASHLATLEPVYDQVAANLADHGAKFFFPIWPYMHAPASNGKLVEHLVFTAREGDDGEGTAPVLLSA